MLRVMWGAMLLVVGRLVDLVDLTMIDCLAGITLVREGRARCNLA